MYRRYSSRLLVGRFFLLLIPMLAGCVVPAPGLMKWEICFAYGPEGTVVEHRPDGTVVEHRVQDSDEAVKATMRACRD